jgi:hypothetical protein
MSTTPRRHSNSNGIRIPFEKLPAFLELLSARLVFNGSQRSRVIAALGSDRPPVPNSGLRWFFHWVRVALVFVFLFLAISHSWLWGILSLIMIPIIFGAAADLHAPHPYAARALKDREFYDRVMALNGWIYEVHPEDTFKFAKLMDKSDDPIGAFGDFISENDVENTMWPASALPHSKSSIQESIIEAYNSTNDTQRQQLLRQGLRASCHFFHDLSQPITIQNSFYDQRSPETLLALSMRMDKELSDTGNVDPKLMAEAKKSLEGYIENAPTDATLSRFRELLLQANSEYEALKVKLKV